MLPAAPAPRRRPDARPEGAGRLGAARRNQPPTTEGGSPRQSAGGTAPAGQGRPRPPRPSGLFKITGWAAPATPKSERGHTQPAPQRLGNPRCQRPPRPPGRPSEHPTPPPPPHQRTGQGLPSGAGRGSTGTDQVGKPPSDGDGGAGRCPRRDRCPHPDGRARAISIRAPQGHTAFVPPSPRRNRLPPGAYGGTYRRRKRRPPGV